MRLLAIVAVAVFAAPSAASATNRAVTISGSRFQPAVLLALVGDTVTWTNRDAMLHNATARTNSWTTHDLKSGQT
ncbi:MAG: copper-binding protein, partial [Actinomycetota bacterium]|nr:copper-binding protein [Actinomycetota bacterium]